MDKNIVKTRLGHYWTPGAGAQTALVVSVNAAKETVNLVVWDGDGDMVKRKDVPISAPFVNEDKATFHLVANCFPECPESGR